MAELNEYRTVINGVETTLRLTAEDAKKRGIAGDEPKKAAEPAKKKATTASRNKARTAANKAK